MSELPNAPQALSAAAATSIPFPDDDEAPWTTWKETIPDDAMLRKLGGDVLADELCHLDHAESLSWKKSLGERIAALHQLICPFGKIETASILHEVVDYIHFLHGQVQAMSSPYLHRPPSSAPRVGLPVTAGGERAGTIFVAAMVEPSDLRNRGLCLVPVSCSDRIPAVEVCPLLPAMGLVTEEEDKEVAPASCDAASARGDHHPGQTV